VVSTIPGLTLLAFLMLTGRPPRTIGGSGAVTVTGPADLVAKHEQPTSERGSLHFTLDEGEAGRVSVCWSDKCLIKILLTVRSRVASTRSTTTRR